MTRPYQEIITELVDAVREQAEPTCVRFELGITGGEFSVQFDNKDAKSLQSEGISMRNLRGEFIKESPAPVDNQWIEWNGGECPIPDYVNFKVRLQSGDEGPALDVASGYHWEHNRGSANIIAYMLIGENN